MSFFNTSTNTKPNTSYVNEGPNVWVILMYALMLGLLLEVFNSCRFFWPGSGSTATQNLINALSSLGAAMLIGGACYGIGCLGGFLFGIPKIVQNSSVVPEEMKNNTTRLIQNDNLVQISDWLTKIIVGVGLTQLYNILPLLHKIGNQFGSNFGIQPSGTNIAIGTILYFSIVGFLSGYLWTRLFFFKRLAQDIKDVEQLQREVAEVKSEKEKVETEKFVAETEKEKKENELAAYLNTFSSHITSLKDEYKKDLQNLSADPQKGKWGGKSEANDRKLSASVETTSYDEDLFSVELVVTSTNPDKPLTGNVIFHLHPTFPKPQETVAVSEGKAILRIVAWGAFTVGAECDNGQTKLELDLAKDVPDAPSSFCNR